MSHKCTRILSDFRVSLILVFLALSGLLSTLFRHPPEVPRQADTQPFITPPESDSLATRTAQLLDTSTPSNTNELAQAILRLPPAAQYRELEQLKQRFLLDPDRWFPLVESLVQLSAQSNPSLLARFLVGIRDDSPAVQQLERKLITDWASRNFDEVTGYLEDFLADQSFIPTAQLDTLILLAQTRPDTEFTHLLGWLNTLQDNQNRRLKVAAAESLVRLGKAEHFDRIAAFLEPDLQNGGVAGCAAQLAARHAEQHPVESIDWLKKIAPSTGRWGAVIVEEFFEKLGNSHPQIAIRLMNEGFTDQFAGTATSSAFNPAPDSSPPDQLYDKALSRVLNGILAGNPNYALTCAEYFHDPELQASYRQRAVALITSGVGRKAGLTIPTPQTP